MIGELNELLTLLSRINIDVYTIIFAFVVVVGVIICKVIDDRKHRDYYDSMLEEKNREIERLADDNRRYRDIYLNKVGFNKEQIDSMSAANFKGV